MKYNFASNEYTYTYIYFIGVNLCIYYICIYYIYPGSLWVLKKFSLSAKFFTYVSTWALSAILNAGFWVVRVLCRLTCVFMFILFVCVYIYIHTRCPHELIYSRYLL